MIYWHVCPWCGRKLPPMVHCDCKEKAVARATNTHNGQRGNEIADPVSTVHNITVSEERKTPYSQQKEFYIKAITEQMNACNDIALLDLVYRVLEKSE